MVRQIFSFRVAAAALVVLTGLNSPFDLQAQEEKLTREPVFRQAKLPGQQFNKIVQKDLANQEEDGVTPPASENQPRVASRSNDTTTNASNRTLIANTTIPKAPAVTPHPLDEAISIAESGLVNMQRNIFDYTALMVKRERVKGKLGDVEYMRIKVRNQRETDAGAKPFSIYMSFLKPKAVKGREVIWVKGENNGKLMVHETGIKGFKTFYLDPTGWLAMQGNRYPISEAGLENLIIRLIEKATRDRRAGDCHVTYRPGAKINGRPCSLIEVVHDVKRDPYEFHKAQVFIDDEMQIPVRYASYDWPATQGGKPVLMEEYTYVDVKLNVGLKDIDFDIKNPEYNFPGR